MSRPEVDAVKSQSALELLLQASNLKEHLLIGVNEVTMALEQDEASVIFIPREEVRPAILIQNFPSMCKWRQIPLVTLPAGATSLLTQKLGIKTLVVMALQRKDISSGAMTERMRELFPIEAWTDWQAYLECKEQQLEDASRKRPPGRRIRPSQRARREGKQKKDRNMIE